MPLASQVLTGSLLFEPRFAANDLLVTSLNHGGDQTKSTSRNRSDKHRQSRKCRSRVNEKRIRYEGIQDLQSCLCELPYCNLRLLYPPDDSLNTLACVLHRYIFDVLWRIPHAVKSAQEHEKGL